jgi:hypothetical protein
MFEERHGLILGARRMLFEWAVEFFGDESMDEKLSIRLCEHSVAVTMQNNIYTHTHAATVYGLDGRGVGIRVPVGARFFSFPSRANRFWGPLTSS